MSPSVTNHLTPDSLYTSQSRIASARMPRGSEPAPSSVIAYACRWSPRTSGSRYRSICWDVPCASTLDGLHTSTHRQFVSRPSCSCTTICSVRLRPPPPNSLGMLFAFRPESSTPCLIRACVSALSLPPLLSASSSAGCSTSSTSARVRARSCRSSGLRVKSIDSLSCSDRTERGRRAPEDQRGKNVGPLDPAQRRGVEVDVDIPERPVEPEREGPVDR